MLERQHTGAVRFVRKLNTAVKYIVSALMFVLCVTRTRPGTSVLPAYYLIASILLGVLVKLLKRLLNQPRPGIAAPSSGGGAAPAGIFTGEEAKRHSVKKDNKHASDDDDEGSSGGDEDGSVVETRSIVTPGAKTREAFLATEIDDDAGMPSSHGAMLAFFSWAAIAGLCIYDALGLFSRALAGLFAMIFPLVQSLADHPLVLALLGRNAEARIDLLAASNGGGRAADAFAVGVALICAWSALLALGAGGAALRVVSGDHTVEQVVVGYLVGFFWCCLSVALEIKYFQVNRASLQAQWAWTAAGVVFGAVAAYYILLTRKRRRYAGGDAVL